MAALRMQPLDWSQISALWGGCDGAGRKRGIGCAGRRMHPPAQTISEDASTPECQKSQRLQTRGALEQYVRDARGRDALLISGGNLQSKIASNCPSPVRAQRLLRRNSQSQFADKQQTAIIFDLDDTLIPTSFLKKLGKMNMALSVEEQYDMSLLEKTSLMLKLAVCEKRVLSMLDAARQLGEVAIVTLASPLWLEHACRRFWPELGRFLRESKLRVIHATSGKKINYELVQDLSENDAETFWCGVKAEAMSRFVRDLYSQYAGQSWKNIVSIGDSNFERFGAWRATTRYMESTGTAMDDYLREFYVGEQVFKVRTKSVKMLESPSVDELGLQAVLLQSWLPLLVNLDDSIDIDFRDCYDTKQLQDIHGMLEGVVPVTPYCAQRRMLLARGEYQEIE